MLRDALGGVLGNVFLEFDIPRLGSRIDAVVASGGAVIPIEFRVGATKYLRADDEHAGNYEFDPKNFHRVSHYPSIFPLFVATEATDADSGWPESHEDGVRPPRRVNAAGLRSSVLDAIGAAEGWNEKAPMAALSYAYGRIHIRLSHIQKDAD